jgi:NAD(P)-dependent dehydrogenase (short-subunit alcohol dehydrogenase family)
MPKLNWKTLSAAQKTALVTAGTLQAGLFAAAWADLNHRRPDALNGSKAAWRAGLFVNTLGPLAYFLRGRKTGHWTEADVPDQAGRVAIVTGANSGLGYETARVLAQHGATVVMACRNAQKAETAASTIRALNPAGKVVVMALDLSDLKSVHAFAEAFKAEHDHLDLLVNNAGIMVPPLGRTAQGFETQFGVNHLAHFALTAQLLGLLEKTPGARVVNVSSIAHRFGQIDFEDLNWRARKYAAMSAYGQSKLANLLFTYELQRRLSGSGKDVLVAAAHPGWASTGLQGEGGGSQLANRLFAQPQAMGALPTLYAATSPDAVGGGYYGPSGLLELGGAPERVPSSSRSHDAHDAERLWKVSTELTEIEWRI